MGMLTVVLMLLALSTASMHNRAEYKGPRSHVYLFRPLTMVVILMIAVSAALPEGSLYSLAIIAGLICSLAGDVLLMLPSDRFIAGLMSFLVAHREMHEVGHSGEGEPLRSLPRTGASKQQDRLVPHS